MKRKAQRKPQASAARARLQVLAAGDAPKFRELVAEMLASPQRLDREAALEALVERPLPELRPLLRDLYLDLDADGLKRDQGAGMRRDIITILRSVADPRDADLAVRASDTREVAFGDDISWELRVHGLLFLAEIAPDTFPYYAVEHLDDLAGPEGNEPANSVFQLLAGTGNQLALYQWLRQSFDSPVSASAFELFTQHAPPEIVQRYATDALTFATKREDEALCTVLVESIVRLELDACYPAIHALLRAKVSVELYAYVAMLLATTNRAPLLELLDEQLHRGRHPRLIVEALSVRPTPEQSAILKRWEEE